MLILLLKISAGFLGTAGVFILCKMIYKKYNKLWLSPLLTCPLIIIAFLLIFNIDYTEYNVGAQWLSKLLGPATVAFAIPIYKNFALIKKYALAISISLLTGCLAAFASSYVIASLFGLNHNIVKSLVPRSITTPIAMDISNFIGGEANMTAVFVIVTGLAGSIIGPIIIRFLAIRTSAAKGLMLGMGAHGCGTSKAFEFGELEGTFSSVAMILAALLSIVLTEFIFPFI